MKILRNLKSFDKATVTTQYSAPEQIPSHRPEDFEVVAGVLKAYRGAAVTVCVPKGITEIGADAFAGMDRIVSVKISNGVTRISERAFCGCTALKEIIFPDTLIYIAERAFSGCSSLRNIQIPADTTHIKKRTFYNCCSLQQITVERGPSRSSKRERPHCGMLASVCCFCLSPFPPICCFRASVRQENHPFFPCCARDWSLYRCCWRGLGFGGFWVFRSHNRLPMR